MTSSENEYLQSYIINTQMVMCNMIFQEVDMWEKWRGKSKEKVKDRVYNRNEAKGLKVCEW